MSDFFLLKDNEKNARLRVCVGGGPAVIATKPLDLF